MAALVAFQALARARRRDRIRVHRRRYRHAPPADAGGRGHHVAYARHGEYPQQLGQPRSDVAAALLADEGPAHRRHPQSDGAGHYHRYAGLPARRVPRGRPVHADPAQGREYRRLQPDQPAGAADLHACGQGLLHRTGDRRFPLRIPRRGGEALQPPAGDEGAVRPGARGQYDGAVRRPARFGDPRRAAARRLFDEGLRRAGEPAGVQFGAGRVHAPDDGPDLHRPALALPQLPRTGHHPADDPPDLYRRGAGAGRYGQGVQLLFAAGTAGACGNEYQERRGACRADRRPAGRGRRALRCAGLRHAQPYRARCDGFGNHDPRHAAPAVRLDVRGDGRDDHGGTAGRHAADRLRPAGRLRHFL